MGLEVMEVLKEKYPVTYDFQMEDIRVSSEGVEERFKN